MTETYNKTNDGEIIIDNYYCEMVNNDILIEKKDLPLENTKEKNKPQKKIIFNNVVEVFLFEKIEAERINADFLNLQHEKGHISFEIERMYGNTVYRNAAVFKEIESLILLNINNFSRFKLNYAFLIKDFNNFNVQKITILNEDNKFCKFYFAHLKLNCNKMINVLFSKLRKFHTILLHTSIEYYSLIGEDCHCRNLKPTTKFIKYHENLQAPPLHPNIDDKENWMFFINAKNVMCGFQRKCGNVSSSNYDVCILEKFRGATAKHLNNMRLREYNMLYRKKNKLFT